MRRTTVILSCALAITLCSAARGVDDDGRRPSGDEGVRFQGGPLSAYIQALQKAYAGSNIGLPDYQAAGIQIGPIGLHDVALEEALEILEGEYRLDPNTIAKIIIRKKSPRESDPNLFQIEVVYKEPEDRQVKVWNLLNVTDDAIKASDLLTAVKSAIDMLDSRVSAADVRYHEATGVLIARGTKRQVKAIDEIIEPFIAGAVLDTIFGAAMTDQDAGDDIQRTLMEINRQLTELNQRVERLEQRRPRD